MIGEGRRVQLRVGTMRDVDPQALGWQHSVAGIEHTTAGVITRSRHDGVRWSDH